jgi:PST family polysaccharide transporter
MALFGMRTFHAVVTYAVARRVTGFRWSTANVRLGSALVPLVVVVFVSGSFLSYVPHLVFGTTIAVVVGLYSLRRALRVAGPGAFGLLYRRFGNR